MRQHPEQCGRDGFPIAKVLPGCWAAGWRAPAQLKSEYARHSGLALLIADLWFAIFYKISLFLKIRSL